MRCVFKHVLLDAASERSGSKGDHEIEPSSYQKLSEDVTFWFREGHYVTQAFDASEHPAPRNATGLPDILIVLEVLSTA